jgi:hypothetical protein
VITGLTNQSTEKKMTLRIRTLMLFAAVAITTTACKALYRCLDCLEPFDYFKCI